MEEIKRCAWEGLQFQELHQGRDAGRYHQSCGTFSVSSSSRLYQLLGVDPEKFTITTVFYRSAHTFHHTGFGGMRGQVPEFPSLVRLILVRKETAETDMHRRQTPPSPMEFILPQVSGAISAEGFEFVSDRYSYQYGSQTNCVVRLFALNLGRFYLYTRVDILEEMEKLKVADTRTIKLYGGDFELRGFLHQLNLPNHTYRGKMSPGDLSYLGQLHTCFRNPDNISKCLTVYLQEDTNIMSDKFKGISKSHDRVKPFYQELCVSHPKLASLYKTLAYNSGQAINRVKVSNVLNEILESVITKEDFIEVFDSIISNYEQAHLSGNERYRYKVYDHEELVTELPSYSAKRKTALKNSATGAFNKMMQDIDFLIIDPEQHPLTYEAITSGKLALSTFFRKSEAYFTFNTIWDLWEEMLSKYPDITIELAETVKGRTTYEKDLMSYFYFILNTLPEFLENHTGKKWVCTPRLVNSASELEPPKQDDDRGVQKARSALTPIVDNEKCTVIVPYASLAIPGRQTTYCYSLNYNVLRRGLSINGDVCMSDLEIKLNGKDDYGLMFYTLTGSAQGRGYPTFLIIFEKLSSGVKVHFHRTHPMRSKDGDYNPISQWIKGCFKWMVGNVPYEKIKVQQGDLAFIESDKSSKFSEGNNVQMVNEYDSHAFADPVEFVVQEKTKENILGYIRVQKATVLDHPEHESRLVGAGVYELRQAKSWEASPKGVWSLRID
jgi:hypothetical protein